MGQGSIPVSRLFVPSVFVLGLGDWLMAGRAG